MTEKKQESKFKLFVKYYKPHQALFAFDLICAFLSSIIMVAFPAAINHALNELLPSHAFLPFVALLVSILLAYVLNMGLSYLVGYYGHMLGVKVESDMRRDLFSHLQKLSFHFFDHTRIGILMSRMTSDLFEIVELAHHGLEDAVIFLATFIGSFLFMFLINWRLAIVTFLMIPIGIVFIYLMRNKTRQSSRHMKDQLGEINSDLEMSLSGIRVTKAFANEGRELERFDDSNSGLVGSKQGFYKYFSIFHAGTDYIKNMLKISVILIGGILYMYDLASFANIITFNLFVTILMNPIQKLISFSEVFMAGLAGLERFHEIMNVEPEMQDKPDAIELKDVQGAVEFQHVRFEYDDVEVLHDINLVAEKGTSLALVGPSGAGKTTICQLIPRFYEVNSGAILVDGHNIKDVSLHSLRNNIGIVQQDVYIFSDTILENIRYGSEDKSTEEVIAAAKMAEIHDDIVKMREGYRTYVGEKGAMLSGGQKQRISLARMFLKNPPIIIFDEATSALDSITEYKIQSAIDKLAHGRTMFIIAHRLSTIRGADKIAVVDAGRIIESGTHTELIALDGRYAQMHKAQYERNEV